MVKNRGPFKGQQASASNPVMSNLKAYVLQVWKMEIHIQGVYIQDELSKVLVMLVHWKMVKKEKYHGQCGSKLLVSALGP